MILHRRNAWIFAFAFLLGGLALLWQQAMRQRMGREGLLGDGENVASYGFALDTLRIDRADIVASGVPRESLHSLDGPAFLDAAGLDSVNALGRKPFLFDKDRVIGLAIDGEARAYPLCILNWHELVNDSLAGQPVLISWNPLCGAAAAYRRDLGDETMEFGVSGLFHNSNLLAYDRRPEARGSESLWSQLTGAALTGPAAARGDTLRRLPLQLSTWGDWRERHPLSLVLAPDPVWLQKKYRRRPYVSYLGSDRLQYPVRPLPEDESLRLKAPVLSVWAGGQRRLYPLSWIAERAGGQGFAQARQAGVTLRFDYLAGDSPAAAVTAPDGEAILIGWGYWFAWYSQLPEAPALLPDQAR